jgi:hypothetical protein
MMVGLLQEQGSHEGDDQHNAEQQKLINPHS